jgi:hypothetical protein
MKQVIAVLNHKNPNHLTVDEYLQGIPFSVCIERGEPFLWQSRIPIIYAFAPESYWQIDLKTHIVVGVAEEIEDINDKDDIDDMLEMRRRGNIFGRWYSAYCREGETGYQPYISAKQTSYNEYVNFITTLDG